MANLRADRTTVGSDNPKFPGPVPDWADDLGDTLAGSASAAVG
jgi:hypothetical protein